MQRVAPAMIKGKRIPHFPAAKLALIAMRAPTSQIGMFRRFAALEVNPICLRMVGENWLIAAADISAPK